MATVAIERSDFMKTMIQRMLQLNAAHDPMETLPHVQRVEAISSLLFEGWARRRGLDGPAYERQRDRLRAAAQVHDLGKVGISDALLKKPAPLDDDERQRMRDHVIIGARLFAEHPNEFDEAARDVVLNHHERWDGGGYPGHVDALTGLPVPDPATGKPREGGKRGEEIPLFARIVALADVYDALSSERCYKQAWHERRVLDTIRAESGGHFDPELVEIFFERLDEVREIRAAHPG
jgi:HD-GYP domain-containing protein (c-di-GMP phosphodiesterase class II)